MKIVELNEKEMMSTNGGGKGCSLNECSCRSGKGSGGGGGGSWGSRDKGCKRDWGGVFKGLAQYAGAHFVYGPNKGEHAAVGAVRSIAEDHYKSRAADQISRSWNKCQKIK